MNWAGLCLFPPTGEVTTNNQNFVDNGTRFLSTVS